MDIRLEYDGAMSPDAYIVGTRLVKVVTVEGVDVSQLLELPQVQDAIAAAYQRGIQDAVEQETGYPIGEAA